MSKSELDYTALSKTVSHALRHDPGAYGLTLDSEGWVDTADLLSALVRSAGRWSHVTEADLQTMIERSAKPRFELVPGRIRARYGHSTPDRIVKASEPPPGLLYHGTDPQAAALILQEGLKPMGRQYVHLSEDIATATQVGKRKASRPVILKIRAQEAFQAGVPFYRELSTIWLADHVPPDYIDPLEIP